MRDAWTVGSFGAGLALLVAAIAVRLAGHLEAARVLGVASLPWLVVAFWLDRHQGTGRHD